MVNAGDEFPAGEDFIVRWLRKLERMITENASSRSLAASQIGSGGLLINGGGSLTIAGTGSLNVGSGALNSAGSIRAGTTIDAGGKITGVGVDAGAGAITGASVTVTGAASSATSSVTGNATVGGTATFGPINSAYSRAHTVTGPNYANAYWDGNGDSGVNVSSVVYKQDVAAVDLTSEVDALLTVALVKFRYISAVEKYGDKAPIEIGAIAEYVESLGLGEWVFRDTEGVIQGINYERLTIPLIAVVQSLDRRLKALEAR